MIFDKIERSDSSPKLETERDFDFVNRSARAEIANARDFIEELATRYPDSEKTELTARFRSRSNHQFRSAEFELLIHGLLAGIGFGLVPHPELPNGSAKRPDFLVTGPSGLQFYLEAVLASEDLESALKDPLLGTALDALRKTSHHNFNVIVASAGKATSQPSGKRLLAATLRWLDLLDPDVVENSISSSGHEAAPKMSWTHEGLTITMTAWPISQDRRGNSETLIGGQHGGGGWANSWTGMRDALVEKGRKYGELDLPLVVAVNFDGFHLNKIDEMQALFGAELLVLDTDDIDAPPRHSRERNGAWMGKNGPRRSVSAAWLFDNFSAYNANRGKNTIYRNPYATQTVPGDLDMFPVAADFGTGSIEWREGISTDEAFRLGSAWPSQRL